VLAETLDHGSRPGLFGVVDLLLGNIKSVVALNVVPTYYLSQRWSVSYDRVWLDGRQSEVVTVTERVRLGPFEKTNEPKAFPLN
tara:strand:- start:512 stop:763 length:252 start_codon:yes stop_codon:yes gene_type:complete